jgi:hypothetical protein
MRLVYVPSVWVKKPVDEVPCCPDCGAPFEKSQEYSDTVSFVLSCAAGHDPDRGKILNVKSASL